MTQSRLKHLFEDKIKIESKVRSILENPDADDPWGQSWSDP